MRRVRLSPYVVPVRYRILLKPDLEAFTFAGEETIRLRITRAVKAITLHATELSIDSAYVTGRGTERSFALRTALNEKAETATFHFAHILPRGEYELVIAFRGVLSDKMRGFYRSRYEHDGRTRHMATTQFEATDARRAFPCFDEPAMKAAFDVSLVVPGNQTAISNMMPVEVREHEGGYKVVRFGTTPRMSTYLLAFIVGQFEHLEARTREGTLVRVFVTPGKKHQAKFALDCAVRTLSFFNAYFGIRYPLPALDLIAIPDFSSGAMENWGAVTYRESALLIDPDHSSATNKQRVALVIAHELAHQWFGNLVTMEWWTHLWLNEGFASYIEYVAVDHLFPEWNIWTQFVYAELGSALELDALASTHPVEVDVHHPDEIREVFDAVSYSKGASIIRMLAAYLGEKDFRAGLRDYLRKHRYANATTNDLWRAFERASKKPVARMMRGWTRMPGYPLISVEERGGRLALRQERFFASSVVKRPRQAARPWVVPLHVAAGRTKRAPLMLLDEWARSFALPGDGLIKLNRGESAIVRVNYSAEGWEVLRDVAKGDALDARDRLGPARDAIALAKAGKIPTVRALDFVFAYRSETDYTVWAELATGVSQVAELIAGEPFAAGFDRFARNLFRDIARRMGWAPKPRETHTQLLLRSLALLQCGIYGDEEVIAHARRLFAGVKLRTNPIRPDLRGVVYHLAARFGGAKEYRTLERMYRLASLHEEKNRIGRGMAAFRNPALLKRTLNFALSRAVRGQDAPIIIAAVWANPAGRAIAWDFVRTHWQTFIDRYGATMMLSRILSPAGYFTRARDAQDIRRFFATHAAPGAKMTIAQALENIYANAAWLERDREALKRRFL